MQLELTSSLMGNLRTQCPVCDFEHLHFVVQRDAEFDVLSPADACPKGRATAPQQR